MAGGYAFACPDAGRWRGGLAGGLGGLADLVTWTWTAWRRSWWLWSLGGAGPGGDVPHVGRADLMTVAAWVWTSQVVLVTLDVQVVLVSGLDSAPPAVFHVVNHAGLVVHVDRVALVPPSRPPRRRPGYACA